jgi:ATP synthase protein I
MGPKFMDKDLKKLDTAIHKAKETNKKIFREEVSSLSFNRLAWHASTDLMAGIAVGCFLGYAIDRYADSYPWALLFGFLLGAAAGFLNILKTLKKHGLFFWGEACHRKDK